MTRIVSSKRKCSIRNQKISKKEPKWNPKLTKVKKNTTTGHDKNMKTQTANKSANTSKCRHNGVPKKRGLYIGIIEHNTTNVFWQSLGHMGRPGIQKASQRHPKGVQKASKRHPKDVPGSKIKTIKPQCEEQQRTMHANRAS